MWEVAGIFPGWDFPGALGGSGGLIGPCTLLGRPSLAGWGAAKPVWETTLRAPRSSRVQGLETPGSCQLGRPRAEAWVLAGVLAGRDSPGALSQLGWTCQELLCTYQAGRGALNLTSPPCRWGLAVWEDEGPGGDGQGSAATKDPADPCFSFPTHTAVR